MRGGTNIILFHVLSSDTVNIAQTSISSQDIGTCHANQIRQKNPLIPKYNKCPKRYIERRENKPPSLFIQ
jgi:hypothetical protein